MTVIVCVWILDISFICCNNIVGFVPLLMAHKYMGCAIWSVDYLMEVFPSLFLI